MRMSTCASWHLFTVKFNWARWTVLLLFTTDLIEHRHVVVLVLHSRSCFTLLGKLLLWNTTWKRSNIFFGLAWVCLSADDFWIILTLNMHHMWWRAFNLFTCAAMVITWKSWLGWWNHVNLTTDAIKFVMLNPVHTLHAKVWWLDIGIWSLMNCLIGGNFVLHRGSKTAFRALRPLIFHLLKLILTGKFIEVTVGITYLVSMRCISWYAIWTFFTVTIHDILSQTFIY